ncbi:auxin response factor 1 [Tanacetum coccineum]
MSYVVTTVDASNKRQEQPDLNSSTSTLATIVTADGNFDLHRWTAAQRAIPFTSMKVVVIHSIYRIQFLLLHKLWRIGDANKDGYEKSDEIDYKKGERCNSSKAVKENILMQITNSSQMVKLENDPMLDLKLEFLNLAVVCAWVICCRVSPKKKALEANIGVGISGVDVMQAVWKAYFGSSETPKTRNTYDIRDYIVVSEESTKVLQEGGLNVVFHHLDIVEDESIKSFYDRVKESTKVLQEGGLNVVFHHLDIVEDESIKSFYDRVKEKYGGIDILLELLYGHVGMDSVSYQFAANSHFNNLKSDNLPDCVPSPQGEEVPQRRFSGTIVGVIDSALSKWIDSEWRSLKDKPSSILRPDKVSPWDIELPVASNPQNPQPP